MAVQAAPHGPSGQRKGSSQRTAERLVPAHTAPAGPRREHEPAHALLTQVIRDLFAEGTAAGAFDVADPETTAAVCYASMHAFGEGFLGRDGPNDDRLLQAARHLFRRAAGVTGG